MKFSMSILPARALNSSVGKFMETAQADINNAMNAASLAKERGEDTTRDFQRHNLRHARSQLRLAAARIDRALRRHGDTSL